MRRTLAAIAVMAATVAVFTDGQARQVLALGTAERTALFEHYLGIWPRFENGFHPEHELQQPWVRLYDSNGRLVRTNEVVVPDAESVLLENASVSKSGFEAVAAQAVDAKGARIGVIELFDEPGTPRLVISTRAFIPYLAAVAPDGFIWVAGTDPSEMQVWKLDTLQRYAPNGVAAGSFVKRSIFSAGVNPLVTNSGGVSSLRASASGVGLYVAHEDGSGEWIELSLTGEFKGRWIAPAPAHGLSMRHIGFTNSGSVYADWSAGTYRLNKYSSTWDLVREPQVNAPPGPPQPPEVARTRFIGVDGDQLVFVKGWQPCQMAWFAEPR